MPRVTQYIRDEDMAAWAAIKNKSAWIHEHLNHKETVPIVRHSLSNDEVSKLKVPVAPERLKNGVCKIHGTPLDSRGKCLQKGCQYA